MGKNNKARRIERLKRGIERCRKCRLHRNRTHAVPGEGNPDAALMLIGEAPGEKEDINARPFCGRAGRFLDHLFERYNLSREECFITSSVKCRPPNNRDPKPDEPATCLEAWLTPQIEIIQPRIILLLGKTAARQFIEEVKKLKDIHGKVITTDTHALMVTYHPAAGMRFPRIRSAMHHDFKKLQGLLSS